MLPYAYGCSWLLRLACGGMSLLAVGLSGLAMAGDNGADPYQLVEYRAPDNSFSARVPGYWKGDEQRFETPGAAFFGPGQDSIAVYYHRASADIASAARQYLVGETGRSAVPLPPLFFPGPSNKGGGTKPNRPRVAGYDAWEIAVDYETPPMLHNIPKQQYRERVVVGVMKTGFLLCMPLPFLVLASGRCSMPSLLRSAGQHGKISCALAPRCQHPPPGC